MTTSRPAVFLDRDGVLVEASVIDGLPRPTHGTLELRSGVEAACARLRSAGLLLVCVTNQPDIARGAVDPDVVRQANADLKDRLRLDAVLLCPHDDRDECDCRKPHPGLLLKGAAALGASLENSVMVGDRWRDVEAGRRAGCATVFVNNGYDEQQPTCPDLTVRGLDEAVPEILRMTMGTATIDQCDPATLTTAGLTVAIFADGADVASIAELATNPLIKGFTTNPTLMRAAGVTDYESFGKEVLSAVPEMPVSFEVFADEFDSMERQALRIAQWGENVYVKVPVTDTRGRPTERVISKLSEEGVKLNVTALLTVDQVRWVSEALAGGPSAFISVFAGRIADTGRDPIPIMVDSLDVLASHPNLRLIWASPREVLNIVQADEIGCHVITVTHDLLRKLPSIGKGLQDFSLETVRMFHRDAVSAGFVL